MMSNNLQPPETVIYPHPSVFPPAGYSYPKSSIYKLNETWDCHYTSGWFYTTQHKSMEHLNERDHLLCITTPPNTRPYDFQSGHCCVNPIPGMIQMTPGIPYAHCLNGDKTQMITVACLHTLASLSHYPDGQEIHDLATELLQLSWEGQVSQDGTELPPVYRIEGLKRNDRSAIPPTGILTYDGSYNLASTVLKGYGQGIVMPAVQAATTDAQVTMGAVNKCLYSLYRRIMPKMISREEWESIEFNSVDNNVFGFGGLEPNNTGLQMNVSSEIKGGSLETAIGLLQGSWHVDKSDDPSCWTFMTLLLRVPPGKYYTQ